MSTDQDTLDEITKRLVGETIIREELRDFGVDTQFWVFRADNQRQVFRYATGPHTDRTTVLLAALAWANEVPGVVTTKLFGDRRL